MKTVKQILTEYSVQYKEKGADYIVRCLNPGHTDSHPSLHIDMLTGKYHCWSCGFAGNIYRLFNEEEPIIQTEVYDLMNTINEMLSQSEGVEIPDSASYLDVGYRNISKETLSAFELFTHSDYPGRVCIPIKNELTGIVTNIVARSWKSSVSPKYLVYPMGVAVPVYPLVQNDTIVLVEGIFDMLNCHDHNYTNVTCSFGTKNLNSHNFKEKLNTFIILGAKRFVFLYDNDAAGIKAAKELSSIMNKAGLLSYVANEFIPEGKDPGELTASELDLLFYNIDNLISQ